MGKIVYTIGVLFLVILSASFYIMLQDEVRIDVTPTKTIYSVWEDDSWEKAATEYVQLWATDPPTEIVHIPAPPPSPS